MKFEIIIKIKPNKVFKSFDQKFCSIHLIKTIIWRKIPKSKSQYLANFDNSR